ncbi:MAG: AAA family ATPase [Ardenticatenaceae bacterium]
MDIKLQKLTLQWRKSLESLDLSSDISYIHGPISVGKSSIMRLIDYCLGGSITYTPAISQELVSVELLARIADYDVLLKRDKESNNAVEVTWQNNKNQSGSVRTPIKASRQPIWADNVFNLSDLIFHLADLTPIKVRRSKQDENSPLIRLSFRDLLWYCYLDQHHLDSSFYRLQDPFRSLKSRDAMRFVTGFYSERMNELEIEFDRVRSGRLAKLEAAKQIRSFLQDFGYEHESDVTATINATENELHCAQRKQATLREQHQAETHFADELRRKLRALSDTLAQEEEALADLDERIAEQEGLKAELLSARFKLARAESASAILSGVSFEYCPACGTDLEELHQPSACHLCGSHSAMPQNNSVPQAEIVKRDLTSRIEELTESIKRHKRSHRKQKRVVAKIQQKKATLDAQLTMELAHYDSAYLARSREIERRIATLQERKRGLDKMIKMAEAITQLEKEAACFKEQEEALKKAQEAEKSKLAEAEKRIQEIEQVYLESLLRVKVPGIRKGDKVEINRRTWIPWIIPEKGDAYTFYDAGSGGKKTLLNVCYALSVHHVAAKHGLPLPTFLMIDTPMKNIGEDVNKNISLSFYKYLYDLARSSLSTTQIIIIDKEYFAPPADKGLDVSEQYMSDDNPLIPYYRGP